MLAKSGGHFASHYFYGGLIMSVFETVKAAVTLRQAAEHYGLRIPPSGMICCPFHEDRHPSLKLNEDYFYCFGCGAAGDVVDFTARLFGLSCYEAAQKLTLDFGISPEPGQSALGVQMPRRNQSRLDEIHCRQVLTDYLHLLQDWKIRYALQTPGDILDERFVASCKEYDHIVYLLDLLTQGNSEEQRSTVSALLADGSVTGWETVLTENRKEAGRYGSEPEIA